MHHDIFNCCNYIWQQQIKTWKMSVNYSMFVRRRMEEENGSGPSPMPIIGLYAAAASLACSLAMFLNSCIMLFNLRWFSPNFFALNATWLTLLAVATKLTGDLTPPISSITDEMAKLSSTVFLTVAMANFFTTLGSVKDTYILTNLTALSILVITVVVDLCIQVRTRVLYIPLLNLPVLLLLCMFITIVCSALAVPSIKKRAESKYQRLAASDDEKHIQSSVEELRLSITKYWVMAASGSPRPVMKRLVTSVFTGIVCLFSSLFLILVFRHRYEYMQYDSKQSEYKWSINLILFSQYYATLPSFIISAMFLISVLGYKYEDNGIKMSREEFTIESYWTEKLVELRQSSIPMRFKRRAVRKLVHNIKSLVLTFCVLVQILIVMWCKFCYVLSFYLMLPLVFVVHHLGRLFHKNEVSDDQRKREIDLNCFVILLEGEKQFPNRLLRKIINRVDKHVEMGKRQRPHNLFNLLNNQSFSLSGIVEFDSNRVPSLLCDEPPNCWTLPVVTLTAIAIALPNVATQHVDRLVKSVDQGILYASLIDDKCGLKRINVAADVVWVGVELHNKWLDIDLEDRIGEVNYSAKEIIQTLANVAEKTIVKFKSTKNTSLVENPLYWPADVLAANSMYRISRTILLFYENGDFQAEELFKKIICMIADILAACFTNLPLLIATKCRCNAIEEREKSVRDAAILLGETEDILKRFEERQVSSIGSPTQPLRVDEWRRYMMETQLIPTIISPTSATTSNEHVVVQTQDSDVMLM